MLRVYIVDDEQHAIDGLTAMLKKKLIGKVEVVGSNHKPSKAIEEIEQLNIDALFLDVEMPEMTGLELLQHFPEKKFQVIFTTAHEGYAIKAIKVDAIDYLVKPLSPQDIYDAVHKCIAKQKESSESSHHRITLSAMGELIVCSVDDIIMVEADNNYSIFYFTNRGKVVVSKTLKEYDDVLSQNHFFRCHQSYLVNTRHVLSVQSNDGDIIHLTSGLKADLSRRKKTEFIAMLKQGDNTSR